MDLYVLIGEMRCRKVHLLVLKVIQPLILPQYLILVSRRELYFLVLKQKHNLQR